MFRIIVPLDEEYSFDFGRNGRTDRSDQSNRSDQTDFNEEELKVIELIL